MPDIIPQDDTPRKKCNKCFQWKLATHENFYVGKSNPDGLQYTCIACRKQMSKKPPKVLPERIQCRICGNEFPATAEYLVKDSTVKSGVGRLCKSCANEKSRQYKHTHPKEYAEWASVYNKKWYQENYEYALEYRRQYRQSERGHLTSRVGSSNRRARKQAARGTFTSQDIQRQHDAQRGKCYYCHAKLSKNRREYHVDHVTPLTRGGTNDPSNLVLTCPHCNLSKHNKLPHEWPEGGRLL